MQLKYVIKIMLSALKIIMLINQKQLSSKNAGTSYIKGSTTYFHQKRSHFPLPYIRFTKFVRRNLFNETGPRCFGLT